MKVGVLKVFKGSVRSLRWASKRFWKVRKSQIRKLLGSFRYRKSANFLGIPIRKFLRNSNPQIYTKYFTTLSQNCPKNCLLTWFFYFEQIFIRVLYTIFKGEKVCVFGFAEVFTPQITKKILSPNRKSAKCHICGRSANLTNLRICGLWNLFADRPALPVRYEKPINGVAVCTWAVLYFNFFYSLWNY